jgi:hypothetical protein
MGGMNYSHLQKVEHSIRKTYFLIFFDKSRKTYFFYLVRGVSNGPVCTEPNDPDFQRKKFH